MSFGVPAGATMPWKKSDSCPGAPASAKVGTSGNSGARSPLVTASARSLPSLISAAAEGKALNAICVWPPMVEFTAGAPPLNGTCTMSSPKASLNNSAASCADCPVPADA